MESTQKYIFVTGGVLSGVGKGITAASIGAVLQAKGLTVSIQKCDPYLNVDAGRLDASEHGECFVTKDGAETDLDLGHYERFLDIELTERNTTLSGKLLRQLIDDERAGKFGGRTVQLVPHLTSAIQAAISAAAEDNDVHIVEIGGTVGDYESLSFIEAIREFSSRVGRENCLFVHVVYVPFIGTSKEFKTKPAQNALNDLRGFGIVPDSVIVRTDEPAPEKVAQKISLFGGVARDNVMLLPNVASVYEIPLEIAGNGLAKLLGRFTSRRQSPQLKKWQELVALQSQSVETTVAIGLIVPDPDNEDAYLSVVEALKAAGWNEATGLVIRWLDATSIAKGDLAELDAIVVPGGFGKQGSQGQIMAAEYALEHSIPYLGIGRGFQTAVIGAARRGGMADATSQEFASNAKTAIIRRITTGDKQTPDGLLRCGAYTVKLTTKSLIAQLLGTTTMTQRYRHLYEVDRSFSTAIEAGGVRICGTSDEDSHIDMIEATNNDYFVATQGHVEFDSRPLRPQPLFSGLIRAAKLFKTATPNR